MSVARFYHDDNEPSIFYLQTSAEVIYQVNLYETDIRLRWADESAERFATMKCVIVLQRKCLVGLHPLVHVEKLKTVEHLIQLPHLWQR